MKKESKSTFAEFVKKNKIPIICVAGLIAVLLIIAIVNAATTAYLKPYEKKYGIKYPRHIAEEFCDAYGQNSETSGMLTFADSGDKLFLTSDVYQSGNHFDSGSAIDDGKQIKSIGLDSSSVDIESLYSSAKSYKKSKQKVTLTDIYGKSKTYQVIAAYYTNINAADDNGYVFPYYTHGDLTEDSFNDYEDRIYSRSLYHSAFDMSYTDSYLSININTDFMPNFKLDRKSVV